MYTAADKRVQAKLEARFKAPVVFFRPIQQPTEELDGYWHFRIKHHTGVGFVRQDSEEILHCYGPVAGEVLHEL